MAKNLVEYFENTEVKWNLMATSSLLNFYFHTKLYINNFNFASVDGLDNFRSNLHTLLKESKAELHKRGIDVDH